MQELCYNFFQAGLSLPVEFPGKVGSAEICMYHMYIKPGSATHFATSIRNVYVFIYKLKILYNARDEF